MHGLPVPSVLADERDDLVERVAAARQALELESRLATVRAEQDQVARRIEELRHQLGQVEHRLAEHRQVLEREATTSVDKASSVVLELIDEQARSRRHVAAVAERARAEQELLVAGETRTRASAALDALRRRSLDQYAGRLAQGLVEGEACPVCGGVEHPAPAEVTGVPVREEDVEAAEREFTAAQAACTAAEATVAAARARESAHAGARSPELLAELVHEAGLVVRDAERQAAERAEAATAHAELDHRRQRMSEEVAGLVVRAEALEESADELLRRVEAASGTSESVADRLDGLQAQLAALDGVLSCRRSEEKLRAEHATARAHLVEMLDRHGFDDEAACVAAQRPAVEVEQLRRDVRRHDELLTVTTSGLADPALHELPEDPCDPAPLERLVHEAATAHDLAAEAAGVATQRHGTTTDLVRRLRIAWARDADVRREFEVLRRLAATVHGEPPNTRRLRLESYVLSVELDQIVQAANRRLHVMSAGRYALLLDDRVATRGNNAGLEVRVLDHHTQETRAPESLSGGEKFLASLSLALGLSEVVSNRAGGVSLDTLFIDEGFGSLDAETLDLAMHTLDSLREHGRTVGVISHVEAMKERIPAQLLVEHAPGGWSMIRTLG
ncbi:SbcC/MukB-like Walker B domain-containing protein [Nocardioides daphniae]|uniref:Nuclease SbcCD subunit C n=1 Tax=Nocardioides daphniae TaxID=402297 RepID=A0A4P7UBT8_9ACTN|nr:SbcC/MukB-like Walker B domain-containing protein [Nocardioides daphniae]QCC77204.1 hypothetical protein E2C04_08290 [Nocardioides daphniae]